MPSKQHEISDLRDFLKVVEPYGAPLWVYRGQPNETWPLRPKAGRPEFYDSISEQKRKWLLARKSKRVLLPRDLGSFKTWRDQAVAVSDVLPESDFECLAYAQHYGLATRLLDWTSNPLVGLYFAAECREKNHEKVNGVVFAYHNLRYVDPETKFDSVKRVCMYKPRPFDRRLLMQDAVFTYHPEPHVTLIAADLIKIVVLSGSKDSILRQLSEIGIDRKRLFPDLEGLSAFLNWKTKRATKARKLNRLGK